MYHGGIDPGLDGALVVVDEDERIIYREKTPIIKGSGKGKKRTRDAYDLPKMKATLHIFSLVPEGLTFWLEKGQALPAKMGGSQANFQRGLSSGLWQGLLTAYAFPYHLVRPQTWQKIMIPGTEAGKSKEASIAKALEIWPDDDWKRTERCKNYDNGLTDAALMALYGLRLTRSEAERGRAASPE